MKSSILPRELVARQLAVSTTTLLRYESRGLIHPVREGEVEGYCPTEIQRVWTIVTYQRDLGINLAGVEVILRLRDQAQSTRDRLDQMARSFLDALGEEGDVDERA